MKLRLDVKKGYKFLIILILFFIALILFVKPKIVRKFTGSIDEIKSVSVKNGNIVGYTKSDDEYMLVNKREYEDIKEFVDVDVSPNHRKMCFVGETSNTRRLFVANVNGTEVTNFSYGHNCIWASDSRKVAFNNFTSDDSPIDVYVYYLVSEVKKNYTQNKYNGPFRYYEEPRWITGDKFLESAFTSSEGTGLSVINIKTGEVVDK